MTDSYIIFTLKMESVPKNTIFRLKMIVKSGLEKNLFEIPPYVTGDYFSFLHRKFSNKNNHLPAWKDFNINF